jgi:hypothetical protein
VTALQPWNYDRDTHRLSVTHDGRTAESHTFTLEQVIPWNPDVLMVTTLKDVTAVYTDPTFRQLKAAKHERVYKRETHGEYPGNKALGAESARAGAEDLLTPINRVSSHTAQARLGFSYDQVKTALDICRRCRQDGLA